MICFSKREPELKSLLALEFLKLKQMLLELVKSLVNRGLMLLYLLVMMLYLFQVFRYRLILFGDEIEHSVSLKNV